MREALGEPLMEVLRIDIAKKAAALVGVGAPFSLQARTDELIGQHISERIVSGRARAFAHLEVA